MVPSHAAPSSPSGAAPTLAAPSASPAAPWEDLTKTPTRTRDDFFRKAARVPTGIKPNDPLPIVLERLASCVAAYRPDPAWAEDVLSLDVVRETVRAGQLGEYCIGAILSDEQGKVILRAHNMQHSTRRSDLHGEMSLLTAFETNPSLDRYRRGMVLRPGMRVYSSAEPCPMCLIRLATVGADTRYVAGSMEDGMARRIQYLPGAWRTLCEKYPCKQAACSPTLRSISHLLFYTFLLHDDTLYDYGK